MKFLILGIHLLREEIEPVAVALPAGEIFLSAMSIEDDQPLADRDLVLRAAAVRKELLERATFIAARYGFAAATAADAAARCAPQLDRWKEVLDRYRGCVEMTMKVPSIEQRSRPERKDFSSGTDYLKALHTAVRGAAIDARFLARIETTIVPLCVATRWEQRDGRSLELAALVKRERLGDVERAGEALRDSSTPFMLSGPWPLEVFANADHE